MSQGERLTLLQLVPEPLPTHRPDLCDLFGTHLPRLGVDCHIVGHTPLQAGRQDVGCYAREDRAPAASSRLLREIGYVMLALRRLARARRDGIHVIQVRDMVSIGLLAWMAARLSGLRFVWWMSFAMSEDRIARAAVLRAQGRRARAAMLQAKAQLERWLLYRILLPRADHVFVQSPAMRNMVRAQGLLAQAMTPVPMAVDCSRLYPGAVSARCPAGWEAHPVFVYLGTLDAAREIGSVIHALALLRRAHPHARLLLVGDASTAADRSALQACIEAAGQREAVRITGWLPRTEALQALCGADICLSWCPRSPVLDLGTPTKLIECMALGLPVIANDHPDQRDILTASGAGLLCASAPLALAEAMQAVLLDPQTARQRALLGPAWIARCRSYERVARDLAGHYRRLTGQGPLETTQTQSNV